MVTQTAQNSGLFDDYPEATAVMSQTETAILSGDNIFLFIIIGLSVFLIISSSMIQNHPAFFIIGFFALLIAVCLAAVVSNTFYTLQISDSIVDTADQFPKILFLMERLPIYVLLMGVACLISGYAGRDQ